MRVMIVEDEPMLAMMLEDLMIDEGHDVVGCAPTRETACKILEQKFPQVAFVDVCLADGPTGPAIAADLVARHVAVVFLTSSPQLLPTDMVGAVGVMSKPYRSWEMHDVLGFLADAASNGATPPPPEALTLAPGCVADRFNKIRVSVSE